MTDQALFIHNAELLSPDGSLSVQNVRVDKRTVVAVGSLQPDGSDRVIDAKGCLLIPGLQDHHVHLVSYAASLNSVHCGPPDVNSAADLAACLNNQTGASWLRGVGYHESVLPGLDRRWLDDNGPDRPVRLQHRSGRLWVLNSAGLDIIRSAAAKLDSHERYRLQSDDGRLYDVDELLGNLTRGHPPPIDEASRQLAAFGFTGINDMTPSNNLQTWGWFAELISTGEILQKVRLSGRPGLIGAQSPYPNRLSPGETKFHLHDSSLPDFPELVEGITRSHWDNRNVAIHCVTEVELVFSLSAFRAAGTQKGDRIEHASVVPPALIEQLQELELGVVTQPNFIHERGDAYLLEIPDAEHPYLYRVDSLVDAGVPVAFGTDGPFGHPDPWMAMNAAVNRQTSCGKLLGEQECVTPENALMKFLGGLADPFTPRKISSGEPADLCLLSLPWQWVRNDLSSAHVRMTFRDGEVIHG